jgi:hypothetical protein
MNENKNLGIGTDSKNSGNALNSIELIEATLFDNVSGGIITSTPLSSSERCRMGIVAPV